MCFFFLLVELKTFRRKLSWSGEAVGRTENVSVIAALLPAQIRVGPFLSILMQKRMFKKCFRCARMDYFDNPEDVHVESVFFGQRIKYTGFYNSEF